MRRTATHHIQNTEAFKQHLIHWGAQHQTCLYLDGHKSANKQALSTIGDTPYEALIAVGVQQEIILEGKTAFDDLDAFQQTHKDWLFGHLGYDLKNADEDLHSQNPDGLGFEDGYFFVPQKVMIVYSDRLEAHYTPECYGQWPTDLSAILQMALPDKAIADPIELYPRISKPAYIQAIENIQQHIAAGDIYETNFCQEFFCDEITLDPLATFLELNQFSKAPFSAYYRHGHKYALCASPERYLQKQGNELLSEPIKGTAKRLADPIADGQQRERFVNDPKERRENIMITDLVRNDLSKVAAKGSVSVAALCVCRSYAHVHQLVSSVCCQIDKTVTPAQALRATFPMGSMTGVPKIRACTLMEQFESHKRGLYSGAIGYMTPDGDFDFNVVIRTLLYAADRRYLSLSVGGAITSASDPQMEYEECLLKGASLRQVLGR